MPGQSQESSAQVALAWLEFLALKARGMTTQGPLGSRAGGWAQGIPGDRGLVQARGAQNWPEPGIAQSQESAKAGLLLEPLGSPMELPAGALPEHLDRCRQGASRLPLGSIQPPPAGCFRGCSWELCPGSFGSLAPLLAWCFSWPPAQLAPSRLAVARLPGSLGVPGPPGPWAEITPSEPDPGHAGAGK